MLQINLMILWSHTERYSCATIRIILLLTMEKQAQVRGGRRHTGGTSTRSVRHGIARALTMSA